MSNCNLQTPRVHFSSEQQENLSLVQIGIESGEGFSLLQTGVVVPVSSGHIIHKMGIFRGRGEDRKKLVEDEKQKYRDSCKRPSRTRLPTTESHRGGS